MPIAAAPNLSPGQTNHRDDMIQGSLDMMALPTLGQHPGMAAPWLLANSESNGPPGWQNLFQLWVRAANKSLRDGTVRSVDYSGGIRYKAVGVIRTFARFHGIVPAQLSVQVSAWTGRGGHSKLRRKFWFSPAHARLRYSRPTWYDTGAVRYSTRTTSTSTSTSSCEQTD